MRVQARNDVAQLVKRDGEDVAMRHGRVEPDEGVAGDRILSVVKVPTDAVVVADGAVKYGQALNVMALHARHAGWMIIKHRVALVDEASGTVLMATPWGDGAWGGDSTLSAKFDPGLPPEAHAGRKDEEWKAGA